MGKINVAAIKPGMVLAKPVQDRNGRMLLNAGVAIEDKHLRVMKIWGISEADIEGVSRENVEEEIISSMDPKIVKRAEEYTRERFRHNDPEHEAVAELIRFCSLRKARELSLDKAGPRLQTGKKEGVKVSLDKEGPTGKDRNLPPIDPLALINDDLKLGSLPDIFHRLVEVVNDSRSSASDVAEIISNDTDLSARLLKVVNSAFYGLRSKIDTISRAVAIIGSNQLVSLAMGMSVITFFKGVPEDLISMRSFWKHSIACGISARILASYHKTPNTERFFVAGLLHDIGRLIMYKLMPEHINAAIEHSMKEKMLLHKAEKEIMGFTHQKMGSVLLKKWKFPVSLEKNVSYHHEAQRAPNRLEASIMLVSDVIVNAMELGTSGERCVPVLSSQAWNNLGLPLSVITQSGLQVEYQVTEIIRFFMDDE